jgi:hypothetical protein
MTKPREFKFKVMPEEYGWNIIWDMASCDFHDGKKFIPGTVHVIEYSEVLRLRAALEEISRGVGRGGTPNHEAAIARKALEGK